MDFLFGVMLGKEMCDSDSDGGGLLLMLLIIIILPLIMYLKLEKFVLNYCMDYMLPLIISMILLSILIYKFSCGTFWSIGNSRKRMVVFLRIVTFFIGSLLGVYFTILSKQFVFATKDILELYLINTIGLFSVIITQGLLLSSCMNDKYLKYSSFSNTLE